MKYLLAISILLIGELAYNQDSIIGYSALIGEFKEQPDLTINSNYNDTLLGSLDTANVGHSEIALDFSHEEPSLKNATSTTFGGSNSWKISEPPLVVQPSPTPASIANQVNESVDLYTGKLNVDIPLFTLQNKDIQLPINIRYNTSGVKVDEIASWVGSGWALNAGGCISRVMKGLPDEFEGDIVPVKYSIPAYGYLKIKDRDGGVNLKDYTSYSDDKKMKLIKFANWQSITGEDLGNGFGHGEGWDTQPDEFYFNFGDYSGKFVMDQDGDIHLLPNANLRITKTIKDVEYKGENYPKIVQFTVHTADGIKYTFGDLDLTSVEQTILTIIRKTVRYAYIYVRNYDENFGCLPQLYGSYLWKRFPELHFVQEGDQMVVDGEDSKAHYMPYTSCWYLKEIESPTGQKITFEYTTPDIALFYVQSRGERIKMPNISEMALYDCNQNPPKFLDWAFISPPADNYASLHKQEVTFCRNELVVYNKRLSSIHSTDGTYIKFIPRNILREDLLGDKSLEYMKVYNNEDVNTLSYKFEYSYNKPELFEGITEYYVGDLVMNNQRTPITFKEWDNNLNLNLVVSEQKRLQLKRIYKYGEDMSSNLPPYEFEYDEQILPRRTGYKQDKWGYYNSNEVGTLMPQISYRAQGTDIVPRSGKELMIWSHMGSKEPSYRGANQNPDETLSQAGILKRIAYPTKGAKEFFYELNEVKDIPVGGLRVKEVRSYEDKDNISDYLAEYYYYSGGYEVKDKIYQYELPTTIYGHKDIFGSSTPVNSEYSTKGGVVGYTTVRIVNSNGEKSINTFASPANVTNISSPVYNMFGGIGTDIYPYPQDMNKDWKRGLLQEVKLTMQDESKATSKINHYYDINPTDYTVNYVHGLHPSICYYTGIEYYLAGIYKYESGMLNKIKETNLTYSSEAPGVINEAFKSTKDYEYQICTLSGRQYSVLQSSTLNSTEGDSYRIEYKYPHEIQNNILYPQMVSKNIISPPIETIKYNSNGQVIGATINSYSGDCYFQQPNVLLCNSFVPGAKYLLETNTPITDYKPFYSQGRDSRMKEEIVFDAYDDNLNLLQYHKTNGINNSYIYGHNNTLPIAKATNAPYDQVFFTGFEDGPEILHWHEPFEFSTEQVRSGEYSIKTTNSGTLEMYYFTKLQPVELTEATTFKFSGWVYSTGPAAELLFFFKQDVVEDSPYTEDWDAKETSKVTATGKWVYVEEEVTVPASVKSIFMRVDNEGGGDVYFDDLRFHPADAQMVTYTHKPLVGITSETGVNHNETKHYVYDGLGRLKQILDNDKNIIEEYDYHYAGE